MSCCSSSGSRFSPVRYASTCPKARRDSRAAINAGPPLFAIMHRPYWRVTSVLLLRQRFACRSEERRVCKMCIYRWSPFD